MPEIFEHSKMNASGFRNTPITRFTLNAEKTLCTAFFLKNHQNHPIHILDIC